VSPLGTVASTQRDIEVRTIDVLTIANGLISAIWVVSDDLALLRQLGAVKLTPSLHPDPLRLGAEVGVHGMLDGTTSSAEDGRRRGRAPGWRGPKVAVWTFQAGT
jgi:hypothetical protein